MINERTYELINQYLSGELKGVALDAFKNQLKEDEELQKEVATQHQIIQSIQDARHKELKAYIQANSQAKPTIQLNRTTMYWAVGSAAAIALIVVAFIGVQELMKPRQDVVSENELKPTTEQTDNAMDTLNEDEPLANVQIDTQTLAIETPVPGLKEMEAPTIESLEDANDDVVEEEEMTETDATTGGNQTMEDMVVPEKNLTEKEAKKSPTSEKPESTEYKIQKDEMLANQVVVVNTINPNFDSYAPARATSQTEISTQSDKSYRDKSVKTKDEEVDVVSGEAEESDKKIISTRNVELQYWKSPINYTGYTYNGSQVKLYGVKSTKKLDFTELDNRLYMKMDGKQFFIEKNNKYNRMVEVTNPTLLKVLNE